MAQKLRDEMCAKNVWKKNDLNCVNAYKAFTQLLETGPDLPILFSKFTPVDNPYGAAATVGTVGRGGHQNNVHSSESRMLFCKLFILK